MQCKIINQIYTIIYLYQSTLTYPCFITWRFHNFITSFSPSLTSENSSICWRLGGRIGKKTNTTHQNCMSAAKQWQHTQNSTYTQKYIKKIQALQSKKLKKCHLMQRLLMVNYILIIYRLYPYCIPKLCAPGSASPLWRRKAGTNNENLFKHKLKVYLKKQTLIPWISTNSSSAKFSAPKMQNFHNVCPDTS